MKKILLFFFWFVITVSNVCSQGCMDTVSLQGYLVVETYEVDLSPRRDSTNPLLHIIPIDGKGYIEYNFIPTDSLNTQKPLSYWLQNNWKKRGYFFLFAIEPYELKFFNKKCYEDNKELLRSIFKPLPILEPPTLYQISSKPKVVFQIYYIEALWLKFSVENNNQNKRLVSSRILWWSANNQVKQLDWYIHCSTKLIDKNPKFGDDRIKILEEK